MRGRFESRRSSTLGRSFRRHVACGTVRGRLAGREFLLRFHDTVLGWKFLQETGGVGRTEEGVLLPSFYCGCFRGPVPPACHP